MPLRDLSQRPGIVPGSAACTPEAAARNWDAVRINIQLIVNNLLELQANNNLPNQLAIDLGDDESTLPNTIRWAISLNDETEDTFIEPIEANNWRGQVLAFPCRNSRGDDPDLGNPIWVVLPGRDYVAVNLPAGRVFSWTQTNSGENSIVSDYSREQVYWGLAQGDSTDGPPWQVVVRQCDDVLGNNPVAPDITVYLPSRTSLDHDVRSGDVISYTKGTDGTYTIVSDYTSVPIDLTNFYLQDAFLTTRGQLNIVQGDGISIIGADDPGNEWAEYTFSVPAQVKWGKCQHQWEKNSGSWQVSMKDVPAYPTNETESGAAFYGKLPQTTYGDPNVWKGKILPYVIADSGAAVVIGNYMDGSKIGDVKQHMLDPEDSYIKESSIIINGWGRQNGSDNGSGNGGTGLDVEGYFLFAKEETGVDVTSSDLVAEESHDHTVGSTGSASTGITVATAVDAHPKHTHALFTHCGVQDFASAADLSGYLIIAMQDDHGSGNVAYSSTEKTNVEGGHVEGDHADLTLTHSATSVVTDPEHTHSSAGTNSSHSDPARVRLFFMERLDNSFESLGI
jgi:hypothetical protein